jgi:hypothetical protein
MSWLDRLKDKFLGECREWWKLWSSWLAILWGCITTVFWYEPTLLGELVNVLPMETRAYLSPLVLGLVAGLPITIRLLKQQKLQQNKKDPE